MCKQEDEGLVDAFIPDLYSPTEHCTYRTFHNEMEGDRIVVRTVCFLDRLQLDAALTLESAETQVCQVEAVKLQQPLLRAGYCGGKLETPVCTGKKGTYTLTRIVKVPKIEGGTNRL